MMMQTHHENPEKRSWTLPITFLVIGAVLGFTFGTYYHKQSAEKDNLLSDDVSEVRDMNGSNYKFINPLLECESLDASKTVIINRLNNKITDFTNQQLSKKNASHISVYFRDLNNGPWTGINEKENFSPASLLKVPIMIAYFKMAEVNPGVLQKKITFENIVPDVAEENIVPKKSLEIGNAYTVEELISYMILYSDNDAADLLLANIGDEFLLKIYRDLGINAPSNDRSEDYMSVKTYASFFRILYNASYLNREMSEKALELLSKVEYKGGLIGGMPENLTVAHKFGERAFMNSNKKQLHDCGIIYFPKRPYLLCVMTRGKDFQQLNSIIKNISKLTYEEIRQ